MTIYSGFSHWNWWFSIVMLVYQSVYQIHSNPMCLVLINVSCVLVVEHGWTIWTKSHQVFMLDPSASWHPSVAISFRLPWLMAQLIRWFTYWIITWFSMATLVNTGGQPVSKAISKTLAVAHGGPSAAARCVLPRHAKGQGDAPLPRDDFALEESNLGTWVPVYLLLYLSICLSNLIESNYRFI